MIDPTATIHPTATVHPDACVKACATIGERASIGERAAVEPGVTITRSHELLSGVGYYPWTATASTFRYGCECHPWAHWTPASQREMCEKHLVDDLVADELRECVRQCARAFGAEVEGVTK